MKDIICNILYLIECFCIRKSLCLDRHKNLLLRWQQDITSESVALKVGSCKAEQLMWMMRLVWNEKIRNVWISCRVFEPPIHKIYETTSQRLAFYPSSFFMNLLSQSISPPLDRIMSSSLARRPKAGVQALIPPNSTYVRLRPCLRSHSIQLSSQWLLCHLYLSVPPAATQLRLLVTYPNEALPLLG